MISAFRQAALPLALAGAVAFSAGCGANRVSERDEVQLGQQAAAQIEQQHRTYTDPAVSRIGQQLAAASERPGLPWRFRVIDRPEVNAISLPGGPIYLFEGLLNRIGQDQGMLAGVLAHEVGHVEKRHAARQIQRSQWYGLGAAVLERVAGGDVGSISQVAANLQLLHYSREQEYEADDSAIRLMRATGHDPRGLVRLLELLQRQGGRGGELNWLRTHPTTEARIDRVRSQIGAAPR